jgi:hypothetical protein
MEEQIAVDKLRKVGGLNGLKPEFTLALSLFPG